MNVEVRIRPWPNYLPRPDTTEQVLQRLRRIDSFQNLQTTPIAGLLFGRQVAASIQAGSQRRKPRPPSRPPRSRRRAPMERPSIVQVATMRS